MPALTLIGFSCTEPSIAMAQLYARVLLQVNGASRSPVYLDTYTHNATHARYASITCTLFRVAPAVELRILAQGEFRPRSLACLLGEFVHCRRACAPSNGAFPCSWRVHSSSHSITTPNLHIECLEHARCAHSPRECDQGLAGNGFALIGRALVPAVQQRAWGLLLKKNKQYKRNLIVSART